jgi:hypothetical protein
MVEPGGAVQVYELAPDTGLIEYRRLTELSQTDELPVIAPAATVEGATVMARLDGEPLRQLLAGVTPILPEVEPKVTVIEVVPWPAVIVAPEGHVHV